MISRRLCIATAIVASFGISACNSQDAFSPPATSVSASRLNEGGHSSSRSAPRSGTLQVVKDCVDYRGHAGEICTITQSNVDAIPSGSTVTYASDAGVDGWLETDVVLRAAGAGRNTAFGHCSLSLVTGDGKCVFAGGTGTLKHFQADLVVSHVEGSLYAWDGPYSLGGNRD